MYAQTPTRLDRVTRSSPCVVCGRDSWCYRKPDRGIHVCMRSATPTGDLVVLGQDRAGGHAFRGRGEPRLDLPPSTQPQSVRRSVDWSQAQDLFSRSLTKTRLESLAESVGILSSFIAALGVGWCQWIGAFTFPMRDADMRVCGFSTRHECGRKAAIRGSRQGVYVARRPTSGTVLLCEGATDTAAMLSLGYCAVGRPSCRGGEDILCRWCAGLDAVVVSDADSPGRAGAEVLARSLRAEARSVRVIEPIGAKDARSWVQACATRSLVDDVIRQARLV